MGGGNIGNADPTRLETKVGHIAAALAPFIGRFTNLSASLERSEFDNVEQQSYAVFYQATQCKKGDYRDLPLPDVDVGAWMVVGDDDARPESRGDRIKHEAPVQDFVDKAMKAATSDANSVLSYYNTSQYSQSATAKKPDCSFVPRGTRMETSTTVLAGELKKRVARDGEAKPFEFADADKGQVVATGIHLMNRQGWKKRMYYFLLNLDFFILYCFERRSVENTVTVSEFPQVPFAQQGRSVLCRLVRSDLDGLGFSIPKPIFHKNSSSGSNSNHSKVSFPTPLDPFSSGATAVVFTQRTEVGVLPSPHVVKIYTPSTALDVAFLARHEAQVLRDLQGCDFVPKLISDGVNFIEMSHCGSPVDKTTPISAFMTILQALLYAHSHGYYHRDCRMKNMTSIGGVGYLIGTVMFPPSLL